MDLYLMILFYSDCQNVLMSNVADSTVANKLTIFHLVFTFYETGNVIDHKHRGSSPVLHVDSLYNTHQTLLHPPQKSFRKLSHE